MIGVLQRGRVVAIVLIALLQSAAKVWTREDLADHALTLMKKCLEVGIPESLPDDLRRKSPEHVARDYEAGTFLFPGYGFFEPALLVSRDRSLYRQVRGFWKSDPSILVGITPRLEEHYFNESGDLRDMVFRLIVHIADDSFDVSNRENVLEPIFLTILKNTDSNPHRLRSLEVFSKLDFKLSERGYDQLLSAARAGTDEQVRSEAIRALVAPSSVRKPPASVDEYLLGFVAGDDRCVKCKMWAINQGTIDRLGRERVIPVYLKILNGSLCGEPILASTVIRIVGIRGHHRHGIPSFIKALEHCDVGVQVDAVIALERVLGPNAVTDSGTKGDIDFFDSHLDAKEARLLEEARAKWKAWWLQHASEFAR